MAMSFAADLLKTWLGQVQASLGGYSKLGSNAHDSGRPSALAGRPVGRIARLAIAVLGGIVLLVTLHSAAAAASTSATAESTGLPPSGPPASASASSSAVNPDTVSKHLVIASFTKQNVDWLRDVPSSWITKRYFIDNPNPPTGGLAVPLNRAREAMAYLTYIIDHYDRLPDYMIFTHGHNRSWHQIEPLPSKIRALNLTALELEGYISLRCGNLMGCERQPFLDINHPNWEGETKLAQYWERIMPGTPPPEKISYKCCAQFAVTRKAVQRLTKEQWVQLRRPLLEDTDLDFFRHPIHTTDWSVGTFYEKWWHIWLSGTNHYCPSSSYCHQTHFSNAIACSGELDRTHFEGETWKDVKCVSAFDHLDPDAPWDQVQAAIQQFNSKIIHTYEDLRQEANKKYELAMAALKEKEKADRKIAAAKAEQDKLLEKQAEKDRQE